MQAVRPRLTGHSNRVEESTFQEQIASTSGNAAVLAAHDAGNRQRALVIGDNQGVGPQCHFLTVQQNQLFAFLGHTYADTTIDHVQIECVHRLTELQHHVVSDVYGGIDTAHIGATQALDHPQWGRLAQVNISDNAAEITRTGPAAEKTSTGIVCS